MEQICHYVRNSLSANAKVFYYAEIQKWYPGESPETVVLTAGQLHLMFVLMKSKFDTSTLQPCIEILSEIRKDERTEKKCAAIRELAAAAKEVATAVATTVAAASVAKPPAEPNTTISAETIVPEPSVEPDTKPASEPAPELVPALEPVDPIAEKKKKYRAEYEQWKLENPKTIGEYAREKKLGSINSIDYIAINGPVRILKCIIKLDWGTIDDIEVKVATAGNLETFQVLDKYDRVKAWQSCALAACGAGHLHMLKYIRLGCIKKEIFWIGDKLTTMYMTALSNGHLEIVQWLHFNNYRVELAIFKHTSGEWSKPVVDWLEAMSV